VVNSVIDAVRHYGVNDIEMPLSPMRVWHAIQHGTTDAGGLGSESGGGLGSIDASSSNTAGGAQ
jgi:carbon-monoxide dehydrogenase large subunit